MRQHSQRMRTAFVFSLFVLFAGIVSPDVQANGDEVYNLGTGIHDITGPIAGLATMGYAAPAPIGEGLHQRLRARAFVVEKNGNRFAYVITDLCFVSTSIRPRVVEILKERFGDLYNIDNVMIGATHTHSAPGGTSYHNFYNVPAGGFSSANFDRITQGIAKAIEKAHDNAVPGNIRIATGSLTDTTVNRSLAAYMLNPPEERERHGLEIDPASVVLRFETVDRRSLGMFNWFAVHGTSIAKDNALISGDNKGFAAALFERWMGVNYAASHTFVAGFANSNAGDASPNTGRDVDGDGDWECEANENFACAAESGTKQALMARDLFKNAREVVRGDIDIRHRYVDMSAITVDASFAATGYDESTCKAAIGIAMLAGSEEDGPGVGKEGVACATGGLLAEQRCSVARFQCHREKPVIIAPGERDPPAMPNVLPLQLVRIGNLAIAAVGAEFTTMAGRRLKATLQRELAPLGVELVILSGYSNAFSSYVATREEYQAQHYEGASTLYGEFTLAAYQQEFTRMARAMRTGEAVEDTGTPEMTHSQKPAKEAKGVDRAPFGGRFGDVKTRPEGRYSPGQTMRVEFWGANPNHDLKTQSSYFFIQRENLEGEWETVAHDWDWETRLYWKRVAFGRSIVRIEWDIPLTSSQGTYRVIYEAMARPDKSAFVSFRGESGEFQVAAR